MTLSHKETSLLSMPEKGQKLLPAIAALPREHSSDLIRTLGLTQKKVIDQLKLERNEAPVSDVSRPTHTYLTRQSDYFVNYMSCFP